MDKDSYQVEVLYFLNPHLIWVEAINKSKHDFVFEQIGIYGILPYETTIDADIGTLKTQRCEEWARAASALMKRAFFEAKGVWFRPTHIDRRTSIFDDNIHKYGEIIITNSANEKLELSKVLVKSGFALEDICLFHQELSLGKLKTKLNYSETQEVIHNLENGTRTSSSKAKTDRELSVKKQTTVFHEAQNLKSTLTEKNLRKHDLTASNIDNMVEKKCKDFDQCKDIDEKSVGRASRVKRIDGHNIFKDDVNVKANSQVSLLLKKKLELTKTRTQVNDSYQMFVATKQFLKQNAKVMNNDTDSYKSENTEPNKLSSEASSNVNVNENGAKTDSNEDVHRHEWSEDVTADSKPVEANRSYKKRPKKNSLKMKMPDIDVATEKRIAYGPPGINALYLPTKVVRKETEETEDLVSKDQEPGIEEPPKTLEMYADVDSNITVEITNIDALKEKMDVSNSTDDKDSVDCAKDSNSLVNDSLDDSNKTEGSLVVSPVPSSAALQKKLKFLKDFKLKQSDSSVTSNSDTTAKDSSSSNDVKIKKNDYLDSDDECSSVLVAAINKDYPPTSRQNEKEKYEKSDKIKPIDVKPNNVNPFKNIDANTSVFVDKLVTPVLMVHNKMNYPIEPCSNIRDVNFNTNIHIVLKNIGVEKPMMLQMISWPVILRGYSLFMIGPKNSGKTLGYLPAVCRLINDECNTQFVDSVGPSCIIVCATVQSVTQVEHYARMFLGLDENIVSCYAGVEHLKITTSLLNGCDLFICTPSVLVRLLQDTDFGVDLRRLSTFVLEDCERLSEVYSVEVKYFLIKIKEMLKLRANKELKVQFIVASRVWCDFMEPLAKKSPNSVVCIGAFQECVSYSKVNTAVDFIKKENKINKVLEFLEEIDRTKKAVIVCRSNDEVEELTKVLIEKKVVVFSCDDTMTVEDLYNLSKSWEDYQEPLLGPILVCCDGNLTHLNLTDANYLVHYSLPHLFSMFCKRFSVLNDNYSSIFRENNENVKIKIFLEDSNAEQLPKILNFIKRCTDKVPEFLYNICETILKEKDLIKATKLVPLCDNLLAFGECPDALNCLERHSILKEYDEPKDWMPRTGSISFKILHYHTPAHYSVRLLSSTSNGVTKKYPQTYSTLSLKMGMYYSKESNRKLHGIPEVGDICAVCMKQNFFVRCQVLKVLTRYNNGKPNGVLIKMIDEEKFEKTSDIYLYHLPEELNKIETHIVQVRLTNVLPKDKDITYSDLARDELKKMTANDDDLFIRGQIAMTIGNCILVDTLEACQQLTSLKQTVVMHNLKKEMLITSHMIVDPEHMVKLGKLCKQLIVVEENMITPKPVEIKQKKQLNPQWAHLEETDMHAVFFASAVTPELFFLRLVKFESSMKLLLKDISKYVESCPTPLESVEKGDIVLAKFPDDGFFERACVDEIINNNVVKCFFVDQGDWRYVQMKDLFEISSELVSQMPFQAIECRLVGLLPFGDSWTEFGTNWFSDNSFDANGDPKMLYVKHFTKVEPEHTKGLKYGVVIIDTTSDQDLVINKVMIDLNLARENYCEFIYIQELDLNKYKDCYGRSRTRDSSDDELGELPPLPSQPKNNAATNIVSLNGTNAEVPPFLDNVFLKQPIRSVPLIDSDNESTNSWDIVNPKDLVAILKGVNSVNEYSEAPSSGVSNIEKDNGSSNFEFEKCSLKIVDDAESGDDRTENGVVHKIIKAENIAKIKNNTSKQIDVSLDSDDFSTEVSQMSEKSLGMTRKFENLEKDLVDAMKPANFDVIDEKRKPKLVWRQNKGTVSIKIKLIGAEYTIDLKDRCLKFDAFCNDIKYGFDFDLYGVVENMTYSDKGQHILVKFNKVMKRNWLTLTKDGAIRKWIVYDFDSIDASSDEEEILPNLLAEAVKDMHDKKDSESEDDFLDDVNYEYKSFC